MATTNKNFKVKNGLDVNGDGNFDSNVYANVVTANTLFGSLAVGNVTGLGTNVSTFLQTPNSLNFLNTITNETGTGNVVFSISPDLTNPNIGAAIGTSVNVTANINASTLRLTSTTDVTTSSTAHAFQIGPDAGARLAIDTNEIHALNGASYATLLLNELGGNVNVGAASSTVTIAGTLSAATVADGTTTTAASGIGYMGMPQNIESASYSIVAGDAGKHIYATTSGTTITIPANSNVAFPIGTTIVIVAGHSSGTTSIALTTDTLRLSVVGSTGTRTLAAYGMATLVKVAATTWFISGNGLT